MYIGCLVVDKKLFNEDAYMKEASAVVVSVNGNDVVLDQTIFFAFSGGQAGDYGTIKGVKLTGLRIDGDVIVHTVEDASGFSAGDKVELALDWDRRYKLMRLHSAAHVVYFFAVKTIGKEEIIGSNVDVSKSRLDFVMDRSVGEYLPEIERLTNEFISGCVDMTVCEDSDNPGRRIWRCGDMEMPCGGTHVKNTEEIGKIRLKRKNIGSGKERIEIMLNEV